MIIWCRKALVCLQLFCSMVSKRHSHVYNYSKLHNLIFTYSFTMKSYLRSYNFSIYRIKDMVMDIVSWMKCKIFKDCNVCKLGGISMFSTITMHTVFIL